MIPSNSNYAESNNSSSRIRTILMIAAEKITILQANDIINPKQHQFQQHLICVNLDKTSESEWSLVLTLILLWFLNGVVILSMVHGMSYFVVAARSVENADEEEGQAKKTSLATIFCKNRYSISDEDDVDAKREANYASARDIAINLLQFVSIVTVQVLVAIKLDTVIDWDYVLIFIPLYIFKAVNFERNFYSIHTVKSDLDRSSLPDQQNAIGALDPDTAISHWSFEAALRVSGSTCEAVDRVMSGDHWNAFCAVRPPRHQAGPRGVITCPNDPDDSHGFCLLNNLAVAAAYARSMYRNDGIKRVAIIDFDVHHGNGTEEIVKYLIPNDESSTIRTSFAESTLRHSDTNNTSHSPPPSFDQESSMSYRVQKKIGEIPTSHIPLKPRT
mmetsp:Transcript_44248/g.53148  ORF Transcript_44248/g.53148 Transcript_44248/m.53148 type:complete len:388 (+) Transcript_44248:221-1384(+)